MNKPILFAGPSISGLEKHTIGYEIKPPISRGNLESLIHSSHSPNKVLIIDGVFGADMSVTPMECRKLIEAGWTLFGCSSMGALRASELYSVGMIGLGKIYDLFRAGIVDNDSELAVCFLPLNFKEITISLIHLRFVLFMGSDLKIQNEIKVELFRKAESIFFMDRYIDTLVSEWLSLGVPSETIELIVDKLSDDNYHPKIRDAEYSLKLIKML